MNGNYREYTAESGTRQNSVCSLFSGASVSGVTDIVPSITSDSKRKNGEN